MKKNFTLKIYYYLLALFMILTNTKGTIAQNQNGLAFDGNDDLVRTTGASALIADSSQISMTCWVYPSNPTPNTSSYDGLCGLRNNSDGDFYLLHYSATTVEARFRNSAGITFDIMGSGIQINTWQHLALTYDGSMLRYYRNGVKLDSIAANGTILSTGDDFYIGGLPYLASIFNLIGKMDEVSLWSKALSQPEINCIYSSGIDTTDANLQLYYKCNQGTAGGNNSAITMLTDASGHLDGTLNNFSLNGSASNFVTGVTGAFSTMSALICPGDTFHFAGQDLFAAGTYMGVFISSNGCDSLVQLTLSIIPLTFAVTQAGNILTATQNGAFYQWVDCNNGFATIPAATNKTYTATVNGSYACIVTLSGCSDTSVCLTVINAGIEENNLTAYLHVYPNPIAYNLVLDLDQQLSGADIHISNVEGKTIWSLKGSTIQHYKIDASKWPAGIYMMKITSQDKTSEIKLLKK